MTLICIALGKALIRLNTSRIVPIASVCMRCASLGPSSDVMALAAASAAARASFARISSMRFISRNRFSAASFSSRSCSASESRRSCWRSRWARWYRMRSSSCWRCRAVRILS